MFFAHTKDGTPPADWEPLEDHLRDVAELAASFASWFGADEWGRAAALWHDLGKYSNEFQAYLKHETGFDLHTADYVGRVDHSTAGAQHAVKVLNTVGRILAYCIAGHHAGLADDTAESGSGGLDRRLRKAVPSIDGAPAALLGTPKIGNPNLSLQHGNEKRATFQLSLFTRMLFSCLVDADFLATEAFVAPDRRRVRSDVHDVFPRMSRLLDERLEEMRPAHPTVVSLARAEVLDACRSKALQHPGLFSLTVPTGGGKTLSSLSFALNHSITHGKRRIIYAIPFTSIIEQTSKVFRDVFSELPSETVLEHHSSTTPDTQTVASRLASENWDAPLVVTTNIQLFESLFAARTSRCRKLHRIVGSVIILDEAQCIPVELLEPTLAVIRELVADYGCTIVLCTGTQPTVLRSEQFPIGLEGVREIMPDPPSLYESMRRVRVKPLGRLKDDEIVEHLQEYDQFLCIVNTRPHAARLFAGLDSTADGTFHLSTCMCGQHRFNVLESIRERLRTGQPCRVVSTQLIEAGVDVDFPVVFRAVTGADSIAQAAGRCNREGRQQFGVVYVFDPVDVNLRGYLRSVADSTSELLDTETHSDLLDLSTMRKYFELHYHKQRGGNVRKDDGWDKQRVMECFPGPMGKLKLNFKTAAARYRWIEDTGKTVFVGYGENGHDLMNELRNPNLQPPTRRLLRKLQRYAVNVYDRIFDSMVGSDIELLENGHAVLINESCYDKSVGFQAERAGFHEPESLIV